MATIARSFVNPFRSSYRYMQRQAHENPALFYAVLVGAVGEHARITSRGKAWAGQQLISIVNVLCDAP